MSQNHQSSHKPDRLRHGTHAEPSRLEQVEEALHRLSKKVGKLHRERKDLKTAFESELAALKETRAQFTDELAALKKLRAAFDVELHTLRVAWVAEGGDGTKEGEPDPPLEAGDGTKEGEPDPPLEAGDGTKEGTPDPPA